MGSAHAGKTEVSGQHHPGRHCVRHFHGHLPRPVLAGQGPVPISQGLHSTIRSLTSPAGVLKLPAEMLHRACAGVRF